MILAGNQHHYVRRGKTLGVVGYGDIGQETANLARAFKMNIVALRRRKELSQHDKDLNLKVSRMYCSHCMRQQ